MAVKVTEDFSEQWIGSEWSVHVDGKVVYTALSPFPRIKCWLWVVLHPKVW